MMNYNYFDSNLYMSKQSYMKINGVGTVKVVPDIVLVNLGVITENISLKSAQQENAMLSNAVINTLTEMGITKNEIRTASYNIEPIYDYIERKQVFKGYRVTNILSVTLKNIKIIGEVIDNATASGANRVYNINFTFTDPSIYYDQALTLAIKDAVEKALEIGNTLGVEIVETPLRIIEEDSEAPIFTNSMLKQSAPTTPIMPGQIDITARIEAIFAYK